MRNGRRDGLDAEAAACFLGEAELFVSDTLISFALLSCMDRGQVDLESFTLKKLKIPDVSDDKRPGAPRLCKSAHRPASRVNPRVP
jgi:hypothetical protein